MAHLERFAEGVADDLGRQALAEGEHGAVDWASLIEMVMSIVMSLMGNCANDDAKIKRSIQSPTRLQRAFLLSKVKDHCECCGPNNRFRGDVKAICDCMVARTASMPDPDLTALIQEASGFENNPF